MAPSFALADWTAFVPRPFENGAFLDFFTSFERDESRAGTRPARWTDTFVREKLSLYSNGYSYHPRFLLYQMSLAGTARQENYESSGLEGLGWTQGTGLEYDARVLLLPEHPYNLLLFGSRFEPLFKEQAATQHESVETSHGASFRYRKKPYFVHVSYGNDAIESGDTTSDVTRVGVDGEYFKRFESGNELSFNAAFNPSQFSNSLGLKGRSAEYLLGNFLNLRRLRLDSSLTKNSFEQEGRSAERFDSDQIAWYELLTAYLPWNFRSDLSYRHQDNESRVRDAGGPGARTLSDKGNEVQADAVHRLFQSLDTTYTFLRGSRTSSAGETTTLSNGLALNYTKSIPRGRILVGTNLARGETDNRGHADVVNEPFSGTQVPGSFRLRQEFVEPGSIVVFLKSPLPPFETIRLVENVHYIVVPVGNAVEIQLLTLPPQFVVPGTYDVFVSYSLTTGDFVLRSETFGGNASVELFEDLLTPYFSYVEVKSDVVSGIFPGIPVDSTTYTAGLIVHRGPLRARGEYQDLMWEVSPYRAWRAEVQYVGSVSSTTSVYGTVSYLNKHYSRGTSAAFARAFTEETMSGSGGIQKQLFARNLFLSAGGSYSRLQGRVDSNAYALNASLMWRIGRLDLSVGASAYGAETTGTPTISSRREHQLVYVKLRRQLR